MNATHKKVLLAAYALSLFVISIKLLIEDWLNGNSLINALKGVGIVGIFIAYVMRFKAKDITFYNHAAYLTRTFWIYFIMGLS